MLRVQSPSLTPEFQRLWLVVRRCRHLSPRLEQRDRSVVGGGARRRARFLGLARPGIYCADDRGRRRLCFSRSRRRRSRSSTTAARRAKRSSWRSPRCSRPRARRPPIGTWRSSNGAPASSTSSWSTPKESSSPSARSTAAPPVPSSARMAAIVIASWESDVHPEFVRQPGDIASGRALPATREAHRHRRPCPGRAAYDVAAGVTLGQADTVAAGASVGAAWFPRSVGLGRLAPRRGRPGAHDCRRSARSTLAAVDGELRARAPLGAHGARGRRARRPDAGLDLDGRRRLRAEPVRLRRITRRDRGN